MLDDERIRISSSVVRHLISTQFPNWRNLPIRRVDADGWDNSTFRLGDDMKVRLPASAEYVPQVAKEYRWLPRLAPLLPVGVPMPLALGAPARTYPWPWAVYRWLEGEAASPERIDDQRKFAADLAQFLRALQQIDTVDGPRPGPHSFYRGGSLSTYNAETMQSLAVLRDEIDAHEAVAAWEAALAAPWHGPTVWVHGDMAATNLIVKNGRLTGVIDFGCCAVGDPACDLTIAWTLLSEEGEEAFRTTLSADKSVWTRARGWALWKALLILAKKVGKRADQDQALGIVARVLTEHIRSI